MVVVVGLGQTVVVAAGRVVVTGRSGATVGTGRARTVVVVAGDTAVVAVAVRAGGPERVVVETAAGTVVVVVLDAGGGRGAGRATVDVQAASAREQTSTAAVLTGGGYRTGRWLPLVRITRIVSDGLPDIDRRASKDAASVMTLSIDGLISSLLRRT